MAGVSQAWYFAEQRGRFSIALEYAKNNADGTNFRWDGSRVRLGAYAPLFWRIRGELNLSVERDDYDEFAGPVPRESDRTRANLSFSRWFGQHILVRLDYTYLDDDSPYDSLTYRRQTYGLNLNYVY